MVIRLLRLLPWLFRPPLAACLGVALLSSPTAAAQPMLQLVGVTVYDPDELLAFAQEHVRAHDGVAAATRIAEAVALVYREDGYLLAEAEAVAGAEGGAVIVVREGRIDRVQIEGVDADAFERISGYFAPVLSEVPVRGATIERAAMLSDDLSGVAVTVEIDYPEGAESARLRVIATPEPAIGWVTFETWPRTADQGFTLHFGQDFYGVATSGDRLRLEVGGAYFAGDASLDEDFSLFGSVAYRAPVGANGSFVEAIAGNSYAARSASGSLEATDFRGLTIAGAVGRPFLRDVHDYGYGLVEARYSRSDADSRTRTDEGEVIVGALAAVFGRTFQNDGSMEATATLSLGARLDEDQPGEDGGDETFWHVRGNLSLVEPLDFVDPHAALAFRAVAQGTTSDLPDVETFYLGERDMLRGYRFAEAEGDAGVGASIEASRLFRTGWEAFPIATPSVFLDAGYIGFIESEPGRDRDEALASAGLGVTARFGRAGSLGAWVATPVVDGPETEAGEISAYLTISYGW